MYGLVMLFKNGGIGDGGLDVGLDDGLGGVLRRGKVSMGVHIRLGIVASSYAT